MNSSRAVKSRLEKLEALAEEIEPLIEGLPFEGPKDTNQSPLHYFSQAASLYNQTEEFFRVLAEHLDERIDAFEKLINKVVEWDLENEGAGLKERQEFRQLQREHNKRIKSAIKRMVKNQSDKTIANA